MRTQEIQKKEWTEFFDSFSRKYEGWIVNLEIFGPEIGAQVEERGVALGGITNDWDEREGNTVRIMTGIKRDDHVTHSITHPTQVSLEQTDDGSGGAVA